MRLGVVFDVIFFVFLREKRVLRREFSGLREVLLFRPDLPLDLSSGVPLLFNVRH